jgi:hypothetical protein
LTNIVLLDYEWLVHLSKIKAAGDVSVLAGTTAGPKVEMSHAAE